MTPDSFQSTQHLVVGETIDPERTHLRGLVAMVGTEIARQSPDSDAAGHLHAAWSALITQLALGPEPEVRLCPVCHRIGMRYATLCGFCWAKLAPLE
jgi:hypothetical protein